ncbi:MAG TPA: 1,4-dihydroxy-2-naphthoate octaprenyltransferase [Candidatus Aphodousia faecavium]|uniref:1,4-dihydroxy-2-naphthoate octaprenyltransferase n=1 Tax=Parasutterella secunda TaxID=626947 RepID=A0ABS2GQW0_9BURK|nr:1,4-dihydroxy-2-naphthoate octaprenyltransferase [Parasutterella secunda]MBM6927734.1 1,4-dihydroxy-2-naphthoate octaprenyltransferase [Parasutterella secunda]HIT96614.1 1,4-dihydroxy-2-naphthoate octaprenyltransferase [Candidatus Aphodousia faecavium]
MNPENVAAHSVGAWLLAIRPKTFGVAVAPVLASLAVCLSDTGFIAPVTAILTGLLAIVMQAITNMENDAGYTKRKAERSNRKGLPRATSLGLLSIKEVELGIRVAAVIGIAITLYFIYLTHWFFLFITLASIAAAYLYMGGPRPIAYSPYGEIVVFIFFGLVATSGTYYLQVQDISVNILIVGCALGLIAAAVLCVNNFRDREHDESIKRYTMAVVLGRSLTIAAYRLMLFTPYALILCIVVMDWTRYPYLLVFITLIKAWKLPLDLTTKSGYELNSTLFATVKLEVLFALTLTIGALIHAYMIWFSK